MPDTLRFLASGDISNRQVVLNPMGRRVRTFPFSMSCIAVAVVTLSSCGNVCAGTITSAALKNRDPFGVGAGPCQRMNESREGLVAIVELAGMEKSSSYRHESAGLAVSES